MSKVLKKININELEEIIFSLPKPLFKKVIVDLDKKKKEYEKIQSAKKNKTIPILNILKTVSVWDKHSVEKIEKSSKEINKWKIV